jgi:hypothetical protein
MHLVER